MRKSKKLTPREKSLDELLYRFGVQGMMLYAVVMALKSEIPQFKKKTIDILENFRVPTDMSQAMIDEAIDGLRSLLKD